MNTKTRQGSGPQISTQILKAMLDMLLDRGVNFQPLLEPIGLSWAVIQDPEARIPMKKYIDLYEQVAVEANDPHLALHMCLGVGPESIGALGYLVMSSPTVKEALTSLANYVYSIQDDTEMRVFEEDGLAGISYGIINPDIWPRRQDAEYSMGITYQLMMLFLSKRFELTEVRFEHERPTKSMALENFFRCPVYYSRNRNAMLFDSKYMGRTSTAVDQSLFPILENYVKRSALDSSGDNSFLTQVDKSLTNTVIEKGATAEIVANMMGVSKPTLNRKMRAAGYSFKEFVDEKRNAIAKNHLLYTSLSIRDIGFRVGFSENAPFTRAFRRWNGITPEMFRSEHAREIIKVI